MQNILTLILGPQNLMPIITSSFKSGILRPMSCPDVVEVPQVWIFLIQRPMDKTHINHTHIQQAVVRQAQNKPQETFLFRKERNRRYLAVTSP